MEAECKNKAIAKLDTREIKEHFKRRWVYQNH